MKIAKILAVTLRVRNMKASVQFYREALDLELLYGGEGSVFLHWMGILPFLI